MSLSTTLDTITQRTGRTFSLATTENRSLFMKALKADIAAILGQMNSVYYPVLNGLADITGVDVLTDGLTGNAIYTDSAAAEGSASVYWDTSLSRARTIKESFDVVLSELAEVTSTTTVTSGDYSTEIAQLNSDMAIAELNIQQLKIDGFGSNYTLDNDGAADLTYPMAQHIDALGAFFTGFPTTGNTYGAVYPTLSLSVALSDVTIDTTLAQAVITDLSAHLAAIHTFTGMDTATATPVYSAHGAITTVLDGDSLELAVQKLDLEVASISATTSAFATATNVTSNSPGSLALDDFVFGSTSLNDDGDANHDSRIIFDKSSAAFRAGAATGTQWNNRGSASVSFGLNCIADAPYSVTMGNTNHVHTAATNSAILGGNNSNIQNSTSAVILGGDTNAISTSAHNAVAMGIEADATITNSFTMSIGTYPGDTSALTGQAQASDVLVFRAIAANTAGPTTLTLDGNAAGASNIFICPTYSSLYVVADWQMFFNDGTEPIAGATTSVVAGTSMGLILRNTGTTVSISGSTGTGQVEFSDENNPPDTNLTMLGSAGNSAGVTGISHRGSFEADASADGGFVFKIYHDTNATLPCRAIARLRILRCRHNGT